MTEQVAYRFIQALDALEQEGEVEPMIANFAEFCEIVSPIIPQRLQGKIEARAFWAAYRSAFRRIRSTFRNIVIGDTSIALEWTVVGLNKSGKEIHYDGVSILDTEGTTITHFRTYFDSRLVHEHAPEPGRVH